jgi:hypothetical protein
MGVKGLLAKVERYNEWHITHIGERNGWNGCNAKVGSEVSK